MFIGQGFEARFEGLWIDVSVARFASEFCLSERGVVVCVVRFGFEAMLSVTLKRTLGHGFEGAVDEVAFQHLTSFL